MTMLIDDRHVDVNTAKACGSRAATRVRVRGTMRVDGRVMACPSRWAGQVGIVVEAYPIPNTLMVRLPGGVVVPFAGSNVEVLA
jgi:hypothetical protein